MDYKVDQHCNRQKRDQNNRGVQPVPTASPKYRVPDRIERYRGIDKKHHQADSHDDVRVSLEIAQEYPSQSTQNQNQRASEGQSLSHRSRTSHYPLAQWCVVYQLRHRRAILWYVWHLTVLRGHGDSVTVMRCVPIRSALAPSASFQRNHREHQEHGCYRKVVDDVAN